MKKLFLKNKRRYLTLLTLVVFLLSGNLVAAQSSQSFSVAPTIVNVEATPGQVWQTNLRLINPNSFPLRIRAELREFVPGPDGGTPQFIEPDPNATSSFANWITTTESVDIPPERTIELPVSVAVPGDAEPGGHFAAVLLSTEAVTTSGTGVGTAQAISSLLFLRVAGDVIEQASVRSFRTTEYIVSDPEATFELRVENSGNVHVQPQGEIVIYNMWGQERGIIPINKQSAFGNVLPDSIRTYRFTWTGDWSLADIGRYTAEVALSYGSDAKKSIIGETVFWFIPLQWVAVVVLFIVGFILMLRWAIAAYIKRMFMLAGIEGAPPAHPGVTDAPLRTPNSEKVSSTKVSIVAPLEAGILDLRGSLKQAADEEESKVVVVLAFVRQYRTFFIAVLSILAALAVIIWFFMAAFTPTRDFVITSESGAETSAAEARATRNPPSVFPTPSRGTPYLTLINRSGDPAALERVSRLIGGARQTITATEVDEGVVESRTVIVYPITETERALLLSKVLNEAPISALADSETRSSEIIVYIGSDAVNW